MDADRRTCCIYRPVTRSVSEIVLHNVLTFLGRGNIRLLGVNSPIDAYRINTSSHTFRAKTSTPVFDCVVNHALVQAFTFLNDTLLQLVHSLDFPAVNSLLNETLYFIIVSQTHH